MNISNILSSALALTLFIGVQTASAQTPVELHISHKLGSMTDFAFNKAAKNDLGNDFNVTRLEYYISKISIKHDGGMVTQVPNHYILANGSQNVTDALGSYNITNVESISFHIGVDTPVNHADPSLQPTGHPLAPKSPSMHWGWASGYRFVAMEGKSGASLNQGYEIHALGDQHYFETTVPVTGVTKGGKIIIALHADYTQAIKGINVSSGLIAHGDGTDEAKLLTNFRDHVFSAGYPASVQETAATAGSLQVYPNPAAGGRFYINTPAQGRYTGISITDVQGRLVQQIVPQPGSGTAVEIQTPGVYFITAQQATGSLAHARVIVQ